MLAFGVERRIRLRKVSDGYIWIQQSTRPQRMTARTRNGFSAARLRPLREGGLNTRLTSRMHSTRLMPHRAGFMMDSYASGFEVRSKSQRLNCMVVQNLRKKHEGFEASHWLSILLWSMRMSWRRSKLKKCIIRHLFFTPAQASKLLTLKSSNESHIGDRTL